jgi:hypothetical protein
MSFRFWPIAVSLRSTAGDPAEPFDLGRHEWQLSAEKPPLANSLRYSAHRPIPS